MKTYTLTITVDEGSDEFWDEINSSGRTGCDEILETVKSVLTSSGLEVQVKLTKFVDNE